jgi:hypothetical protein
MPHFHRVIVVVGVLAVFTGLANAQSNPLTCTTSATVTPALRGESFTELTGDITISCTGGTPPSAGVQIPQDSITVFYNTTVTSRLLPTVGNPATNNVSEALLIIDEPGSFLPTYGSSLPQILCTTPLIGCTATVGAVPGPTLNTAVSSGSTPAPNVYQGVVNGNSVTFHGIPVLAPGASGTRVFRITNVRVSAQPLAPASSGAGAMPVQASVVITGGLSLPIQSPDVVVGFVTNGLTAGAGSPATLSQCSSQTKTAVNTLTFTENFGTAFKTRVFASTNTSYAGQIGSPNYQNIPGMIYNSESYFVLPIDATDVAGLADYGTRLKATFDNVPTGVRIFVSTANVNNNGLPGIPPNPIGGNSGNASIPSSVPYTGYAQLVNGEATSDGNSGVLGFLPAVSATDYGPLNGNVPIAEIPIVNGTGTAVWEAVNTNPNTIEAFRFAVYATYAANAAQNSPPPGLATVNLSFAATAGSGAAADAGSPMPRFASDPNSPTALFAIQSCAVPASLTIAKTHTGNFIQGQSNAAYTVVVSNQAGAGPTNGAVTVTEAVPSGLTLVSMAGTGWTCPNGGTTCTRNDPLAAGAGYPPITVTVNVSGTATTPQINSVSVSGGGSATAGATDPTTIVDLRASLTSPATGSPFVGSSVTFNWTAGTGVSQYHLYVGGSGVGTNDICSQNTGSTQSYTCNGIPTDGRTIYVRLWSLTVPGWLYRDYTYTAASISPLASMLTPVSGTTLSGSSVTFNWNAGIGAAQYHLYVGVSGVGTNDVCSQNTGATQSYTCNGIPTDGRTIYVRLWSLTGPGWLYRDYTYTAASVDPRAAMIAPVPATTLVGSLATFNWTAGTGVSQYHLYVGGSGVGTNDICSQNTGSTRSYTCNGIPTDGRTVYVRLWSLTGPGWLYRDYTYTAASVSPLASVLTPAPNTTLSGANVTFNWTAGTAVSQYHLYVGASGVGTNDICSQNTGSTQSYTCNSIPTDGRTIYVRLWSLTGPGWLYHDYTYTAASISPLASMLTPAPGTALSGSSVTFTWTAGTGVAQYHLYVGASGVGTNDICSQNTGSTQSYTCNGIPTDGRTIYVRLWSLTGPGWLSRDYTYTAHP